MEELAITYLGFTPDIAIMGVVMLILLLISALVSGSEVAFFSLTPSELQQMREKADARDSQILSLLADVDKLLATILVTNNLVNICIVIISSNIMDSLFVFNRFEFLIILDMRCGKRFICPMKMYRYK